jgi:enediyne biosynthesis protein E4
MVGAMGCGARARREAPGVAAGPFVEGPALPFRHAPGGRSPLDILETAGAGCAVLDYDRDGWLDLFLVGGGQKGHNPNALFHNNRDGTFTDVTARAGVGPGPVSGMGCAAGDYDGDGWVDLYVTGYGGNVLYRNQGDGTGGGPVRFADVTERAGVRAGGWSTSAAWGDVDGDGWLDLYVCRYLRFGSGTPRICPYRGVPMACPPRLYAGEPGILYHNNGDGTFQDVTRRSGAVAPDGKSLGCLFTDTDGDGRLDLYVANDGMPNNLFHNEGGGRFRDVALVSGTAYNANGDAEASMGVDAGDFDGDGRLDLVVTAFQNETDAIYHNDGAGAFSYVTAEVGLAELTRPFLSFGCGWIDYDNDGDLDLFVVSGHVQDTIARADTACAFAQPRHLFENTGGRFREVGAASPPLARPAVGRGAAFGDLENDGDLDILVSNNSGPPILLMNAAGKGRSWLRVRLRGRAPNRFGIGARVRLTAGGHTQVAETHAGHSYASTSDPRLHFGLGAIDRVTRLEVRWPRGATSVLTDLPANQEVIVDEPQ